ncbi:MAG: nuclear transport factor 2 family protein [Ilumatobacteraceae bacterium]
MLAAIDLILIHQLLGRYGHTIDHRDWDAFAALFVPDATIDYQGSTSRIECRGIDEILDYFREANHPPAHHVSNIVVDEFADPKGPVPVHSKFLAPFTRPEHEPKRWYGGDYHDVVVNTADGWRFSHKQCLPRWNLTVQVDEDVPAHRRTY